METTPLPAVTLQAACRGDIVAIDFGPIRKLMGFQRELADVPGLAEQLLAPLISSALTVTVSEEMMLQAGCGPANDGST